MGCNTEGKLNSHGEVGLQDGDCFDGLLQPVSLDAREGSIRSCTDNQLATILVAWRVEIALEFDSGPSLVLRSSLHGAWKSHLSLTLAPHWFYDPRCMARGNRT
ncbi:hypothetical protein L0F63_003136 [Massospora cicadina]|nr:hypothetical protein L0F63_003136 [Massospora cicadina]